MYLIMARGLVLPSTGEDERIARPQLLLPCGLPGFSTGACRGTRPSRGPPTEASCAAMTLAPASTFLITWIARRYVGRFGLLPPPRLARLAAHFRGCIRRPGNGPRYDGKSSSRAQEGWLNAAGVPQGKMKRHG